MARILVLLFVGFFLNQAKAMFFVEPLVSYDSGTASAMTNTTPSIDESGKSTGFSYGARLGYHFQTFFVAAEYLGASDTYKTNDSTLSPSSTKTTETAISAIVGFHVNRIRFLAGYSPSDAYTWKGTGGATDTKFTGSSIKAGIGIWLHRYLTFEVDYIVPNFNKVDTGSGSVATSTVFSKYDANIIRAGLTFPIFF